MYNEPLLVEKDENTSKDSTSSVWVEIVVILIMLMALAQFNSVKQSKVLSTSDIAELTDPCVIAKVKKRLAQNDAPPLIHYNIVVFKKHCTPEALAEKALSEKQRAAQRLGVQ